MLSDVINVTGPKIMTIAILQSLGQLLGRTVDDRDYAHTKRPKLVDDVLIMPGVSFAALQNGNQTDLGEALVSHHYEGSWKKEDAEAKERKNRRKNKNSSKDHDNHQHLLPPNEKYDNERRAAGCLACLVPFFFYSPSRDVISL
ncbi:unnamed protein product [Penicillium egyptiacum]|uniref:Uncharacterized protein n=1 Tax=Penicillium egyptiacum TaxID=1303716 RepID=A0A9W4K5B3_9EURO|nr:unnamed protein product [Penicillium egyptiacum]